MLRNELYIARRTFIAGTIGVVALMAVFGGLSGLVINSATGDVIVQLLENLPPALLQAFNFDVHSLQSFEGWMASEPYTFFALILGMMAANGAAAVVAREIDQGTAESVVSLPLSRRTLFLSKVASHLIILTGIAGTGVIGALLAGSLTVGIASPAKVIALLVGGYLTALAFAGVGYAISPFVDGERTATSLGAAVALSSFVIDILSTVSDELTWLARISLFRLFDANDVVNASSLPLLPCALAVALLAVGVAVGAALFDRKDISV